MIKIIDNDEGNSTGIIKISELKPLQGAIVVDDGYKDHIVMRTANRTDIEIMDLSVPGPDRCWTGNSLNLRVRLLTKPITIQIDGDCYED